MLCQQKTGKIIMKRNASTQKRKNKLKRNATALHERFGLSRHQKNESSGVCKVFFASLKVAIVFPPITCQPVRSRPRSLLRAVQDTKPICALLRKQNPRRCSGGPLETTAMQWVRAVKNLRRDGAVWGASTAFHKMHLWQLQP